MTPAKLLGSAIALVGVLWLAFAGGYAVYWWDRRPLGSPSIPPIRFLVFAWSPSFPPSIGGELAALKAEQAKAARQAIALRGMQTVSTRLVEQAQVAKRQAIDRVFAPLIHEVPEHVTPAVDRDFPLSVGFVRLLDAGALGLELSAVPGPAGLFDADPSPVRASQLAVGQLRFDQSCHQAYAMVDGWQAWARDMASAEVAARDQTSSPSAPNSSTAANH